LRGVLARKALYTFQFDHEYVFDEDIGEVFSDAVILVANWKRRLGRGSDAANA
jgi:hypothetical protein